MKSNDPCNYCIHNDTDVCDNCHEYDEFVGIEVTVEEEENE